MSYRIVYGPTNIREKTTGDKSMRLRAMTAGFLLAFCLSVRFAYPDGAQKLRELLLPGTKSVTEIAFETFMQDLRAGHEVGNSIEAFCADILEDAGKNLR